MKLNYLKEELNQKFRKFKKYKKKIFLILNIFLQIIFQKAYDPKPSKVINLQPFWSVLWIYDKKN
jgi:hypothetical protein